MIAGQERLFEIRRKAREGERAQLTERIEQLKQEIAGLQAQETAKVSESDWIRKELEGVMTLWQKNLIQFTRVVSLQRDVARADGERAELVSSVAQAKNKIAEIELQILQIDQDLRAEVGKDLASIRAEIAETSEQKITAEDVLSRIEIRAPQDGTVHEMSVHTVGGVVAAGEAIMMIVPAEGHAGRRSQNRAADDQPGAHRPDRGAALLVVRPAHDAGDRRRGHARFA